MASPIEFHIKKVDPRKELQLRLQAAPTEHAESILALLNLIEAAHQKGLLGLAHGAVSNKDAVIAKLAEYGADPISTNAMRNLITLGKLLGEINPDHLSQAAQPAIEGHNSKPGIFALIRRAFAADTRRGLATALNLLGVLGSRK